MLIGRLRSDDVYNQVSYVVFLYLSNPILTQVLYIYLLARECVNNYNFLFFSEDGPFIHIILIFEA